MNTVFAWKFANILVYPFASFISSLSSVVSLAVGNASSCQHLFDTNKIFFRSIQSYIYYILYFELGIYWYIPTRLVYTVRQAMYQTYGWFVYQLQRLPRGGGSPARALYKSGYCYRCFSGLSHGFHLGNMVGGHKWRTASRAIFFVFVMQVIVSMGSIPPNGFHSECLHEGFGGV